jgi:hypothetical protein
MYSKAERGLVKVFLLNLSRLEGHFITNRRNAMLLLCNIIVNEGIARGVLPVLNAACLIVL